jgi:hypothetical protein
MRRHLNLFASRRLGAVLLAVSVFATPSCGGDSLNGSADSLVNQLVISSVSTFVFLITGHWLQEGASLSADSNAIEVRNGCLRFRFTEPYDATQESGGFAIRGLSDEGGNVVLLLSLDGASTSISSTNSSNSNRLAVLVRDSTGAVLVNAQSMSRSSTPVVAPSGC